MSQQSAAASAVVYSLVHVSHAWSVLPVMFFLFGCDVSVECAGEEVACFGVECFDDWVEEGVNHWLAPSYICRDVGVLVV